MAPPKMPWFRMYCEITGDRKLRGMPLDQRWVWVAVMVLARTSPIPGFLMVSEALACSDEAIADEAAAPVAKTRAALKAMEQLGMIHRDHNIGCWAVTNWDRRQFESDDVTARTRKHRQRNDDGTFHRDGMERSGNVDGTDQKQRAEAETEADLNNFQQQLTVVPAELPAAAETALSYYLSWRASEDRSIRNPQRWMRSVGAKELAEHGAQLVSLAGYGWGAEAICREVWGMDESAVILGRVYSREMAS